MKTNVVIVTAFILAGAGAVGWHAARSARAAQAERDAIAHKVVRTKAEIRNAEQRLAAAETEKAGWRFALDASQPVKAQVSGTRPAEARAGISAEKLSEELKHFQQWMKDPTRQLRWLAQTRANLAADEPFFRTLGLSATQIERYKMIAIEQSETGMDLGALVDEGIVSNNDPAIAKLRVAAQAKADMAYRELLGEEGYQRFQDYQRTGVARGITRGFAAAAVMAGDPVAAPQLENLVQVIANGSSSYRSGQAVTIDGIEWDIVDAGARSILSDAQWKLFKTSGDPIGWTRTESKFRKAVSKAVQADAASKAAQPAKRTGG